ncbi:MAG: hypothetical protein PHX20_05570 [Candidatus Omnitrophica bacterium]|nr:hypothetical protein [Candidatus Omnitrophota bacterium]
MNVKNAVIGTGILAMVTAVSFIAVFFFTLNTTISDFSGGDIPNINQFYYNFFHGRPFQLSIYTEESTQFHNPYAYLNVLVLHGYILSIIIVGLFYAIWPGINTMYAVFIALNLFGFAFFTFKIIQRLSPSNVYLKSLLAFSVFLLSGYLRVAISGIPIILCGPFILAAYYFLISGKRAAFFLTIVSLCLIQEDLAVFGMTFLAVLLIFEKKYKRTIILSLAFCSGYFILWNFVMQPLLRQDLTLIDNRLSSMLLTRIYDIANKIASFRFYPGRWLVVYSGFYLPVLAAVVIYRFFGALRRLPWLKILAFVFLAPAAHLAYGTFCLCGPYLSPALTMTYLAFLIFLGEVSFDWKKKLAPLSLAVLSAVILIFMTVDAIAMTPVLPFSPRLCIWKTIKRLTGVELPQGDDLKKKIAVGEGLQKQVVSNRETIKIVNAIPKDKSVVFWGNYIMCGFLTDRNDFWIFPMYYDLADFLVIQKGAPYSKFSAEDISDIDYNKPGFWGELYVPVTKAVSARLAGRISEELVNKRHTHRIARDDKYVLILERLEKHEFYMPKSTMGLGWVVKHG